MIDARIQTDFVDHSYAGLDGSKERYVRSWRNIFNESLIQYYIL